MNIKDIAERVARSHGTGGWQTLEDMVRYAESLVAELAKENEPVAFLHPNGEVFRRRVPNSKPLYTIPPTAEQIEQETAEACAKVYLNTYDLTDIADDIRSGAWKEYL